VAMTLRALLGLGLSVVVTAFHAAAQENRDAIPPASWAPVAHCQPSNFKVAIDIGHDKRRPGATSSRGVTEFIYNHDLAELVVSALRASGFNLSFLIGESGEPMPLSRRPQLATEEKAALFVSLHHDSAQKQYFSEWTFEGHKYLYSDRFHGYSIFVSHSSRWASDSLAMATLLGQELKAKGLTPSLHHAEAIPGEGRALLDPALGIYAFDGLAVLRGATMPALLLESGLIVNRDEEQAIRSGAYYPKVVAALVAAITRYCARQ
jgi:N-acetylmuramoyl-L-alanine amidase